MYLFNSLIADWFSYSFHKYLSNTYCVPRFVLAFNHGYHIICSLTMRRSFTVTGALWHCFIKGPISAFSLGNNYHAEVKIISKALLCVCKHKAAVIRSQLEVSIPRKRKLYFNSCFSWSPPHTLSTRLTAHSLCLTFHSDVYAK